MKCESPGDRSVTLSSLSPHHCTPLLSSPKGQQCRKPGLWCSAISVSPGCKLQHADRPCSYVLCQRRRCLWANACPFGRQPAAAARSPAPLLSTPDRRVAGYLLQASPSKWTRRRRQRGDLCCLRSGRRQQIKQQNWHQAQRPARRQRLRQQPTLASCAHPAGAACRPCAGGNASCAARSSPCSASLPAATAPRTAAW